MSRAIRAFTRLNAEQRGLLIEAVISLSGARLALATIPFPRLARRLGTFVPPTDDRVASARTSARPEHPRLAYQIGWAVRRAAHWVPFKAVCLPQAMAARFMLGRRGVSSVMSFGADPAKRGLLDMHAWLQAAGAEVTGFPVAHKHVEIACLVNTRS